MSNAKIDVSLDLGYASIGWAVAETHGREPIVKGCGTVVFEPDKCLASERRGYRRQRRHIRATRTRILRMKEYLLAQGVLTPAVAGLRHPHPEPWRLAAQVLRGERVLTAPELWPFSSGTPTTAATTAIASGAPMGATRKTRRMPKRSRPPKRP